MLASPLIHNTLAGYLTLVELGLIEMEDLRADLRVLGHHDISREVDVHFLPTCRDDHGRRLFVDPTKSRAFPRTEDLTLTQLWQIVCHKTLRYKRREYRVSVCGMCEADARMATSSLSLMPPTAHLAGSLAQRVATALDPQWPQAARTAQLRHYDVSAIEAFWSKLSWIIRARLVLASAYDVTYDAVMAHRGLARVLVAQDVALTDDFDRLSHEAPGMFQATEVASAWFAALEAEATQLRAKLVSYRPSWRTWWHDGSGRSHRCGPDDDFVWVAAPNRTLTRGMVRLDEVDGSALAALATSRDPLYRLDHESRIVWVARVCGKQFDEHMRWARHYGVPMHELTSEDVSAEVVAATIRIQGLPDVHGRWKFGQFAKALAATSKV